MREAPFDPAHHRVHRHGRARAYDPVGMNQATSGHSRRRVGACFAMTPPSIGIPGRNRRNPHFFFLAEGNYHLY
jgi:hypothetical protein